MEHAFGMEHDFAVSYASWTNGQTESINASILRVIRQLTSEYGLTEKEWPELIPEITYVLNNTAMKSRNGHTADQLFLGNLLQ